MITIAVDCMGGDYGPAVTLPACAAFLASHPDAHLLLVGLPEALAKQCRLGAWREGRLVFQVSNPVWKNKLRLHSREILDHANALGLPAREIRITIDLAFQPGDDR